TFLAAVVDGRRGFLAVFKDIPVQICQFHQIKQVTKYLTRRPKTEAGVELRTLALTRGAQSSRRRRSTHSLQEKRSGTTRTRRYALRIDHSNTIFHICSRT